MAIGRIISKSISNSRKVNSVSDRAALLFSWLQPHTDDFGRLEGGSDDILYSVVPRRNWSVTEVEELLKELYSNHLIKSYYVEGRRYIEIVDFEKHQTFRKDRPRIAKTPEPVKYDTSWLPLVAKGTPTTEIVGVSKDKVREDKLREDIGASGDDTKDKKTESDVTYLENYFIKAAQAIQNVPAEVIAIDYPVVGKLIKARIKQLAESKVADPRMSFEKLIVYFLSEKKWKKDDKQNWYMVPAEAPTMTNMLSTKTWNKLMLLRTADRDFQKTIFEAAEKLRGAFKHEQSPESHKEQVDVRKMLDELARKMHANSDQFTNNH